MTRVEKKSLSKKDARGIPGYPLGAVLISQLAVDNSYQGQGVAKKIMKHIFVLCLRISDESPAPAFRLIRTDAADEHSRAFFIKFGFTPFDDLPMSLYIPLKKVRKAATG